jgi:hypothetical protein
MVNRIGKIALTLSVCGLLLGSTRPAAGQAVATNEYTLTGTIYVANTWSSYVIPPMIACKVTATSGTKSWTVPVQVTFHPASIFNPQTASGSFSLKVQVPEGTTVTLTTVAVVKWPQHVPSLQTGSLTISQNCATFWVVFWPVRLVDCGVLTVKVS